MKNENHIPGYTISETLHEGNNTIVYKGTRNENQKRVIIKSLGENYADVTKAARLTKEFDMMKNIDIEGANKVSEIVSYEDILFLIMEDFGGISLSDYLKSTKTGIHDFLVIAIKIADILSRIHSKNIMHKNVNPDNILINATTGEIRMIGFGISSMISREHTFVRHPNILEGSLEYMSPEQTGRMNRSTDYRTDLYSLGITFYKLLTGRLPYQTDDAMELIHCHIAKKINPVIELNPDIPRVLSDIVSKLTAKIAEERYQSAIGVKYDLEHCLRSLNEDANIPYFTIGLKDVFSKFIIPEKLYGRENEVGQLLQNFDEVANGGCKLMLITGQAGIGKTALVNEILKPTVHKKGYFISGKFDQYQSNIPFQAFRHAFADLLKYLISESKIKLEKISLELNEALGINASVLTDLIPEFELILGRHTTTYQLNPSESQNRFFFTLRDFIKVFAADTHPLTIFLDDLQWCDDASLSLIRELISKEIPYLFIIGAYRSNELTDAHPLALTIEDIQKTKPISFVKLSSLDQQHVNQLIADSMLADLSETSELTNIIYKRTGGNPFYINEILKNIYQENLVNFNYFKARWIWNLEGIANLNISDNVVQFMTGRLKELPERCLEVLEIAACIGNSFKLKTITRVTGKTAAEISTVLWPAVEKEIILPLGEDYQLITNNLDFNVSYKFLHDRIQQATYSLMDDARRKAINLKIARVLLQNISEAEKGNLLTELVRHYNEGRELIINDTEKTALAEMNLLAGKKAQEAVAYNAALQYFKTGIELLPVTLWEQHYETAFHLYKGYAQNAYQANDYQTAEACIDLLLNKALTKLEKVEILSLRVRQYNTAGKAEEAIRSGIEGLRLLGYQVTENPGPLVVFKELLQAKWSVGKRKPEDLVNCPVLEDPEKKAAARLMTDISPSAYILGRDNLFGLAQLKIVNLSLKYGNCPESAYAYITFGTVLAAAFGDLRPAESFGRLGLMVIEKLQDIEYRCRAIAAYGVLTHHFNNHWNTTSDWFKKGIEAGYLSGDLFFLAHCAVNCTVWNPSIDLASSLEDQKKYLDVVRDTHYKDAFDTAVMNLQLTKNFIGLTDGNLTMDDAQFNEADCLGHMTQRKYKSGIGMYHIHKAEIFLFYEQYEQAYDAAKEADKHVKSLLSLIYLTRLCSVSFFACAGYMLLAQPSQKVELKKRMEKELKVMKKWARHYPVNFLHLQLLMEAEMKHSFDKNAYQPVLYEQAIKTARENKWLKDEAFANELAAKFYYRNGIKASLGYWNEAYNLYNRLGALGKTNFLKENYSDIFFGHTGFTSPGSAIERVKQDESLQGLDVATIVKSSQAISGEIELKSLLSKMMQIIMMNAGAENGILLLEHEGSLFVQASVTGNEVTIMQNIPVLQYPRLPQSIVNYVSNLKESVVLDNAPVEGDFTADEYIINYEPKSVLCSPIVFLNTLYGIVYLENSMSVGAFTEDRLKILNLLSSQMAISIQNALLYASLEEKVQERTTELRLEKKKSDDLLINILPEEVADELKRNGFAEARQFDHTTVLFTDFVNFTMISQSFSPKGLVAEINLYFTAFDDIIGRNGLEKIKTIGDAFLAVAGLPNDDRNHAAKAVNAAMEMVAFVRQRKTAGSLFDIRVGLNSGPVVAGIVGVKKFVYDIWGDTVNTAARMETNSEPGKINISAATNQLLKNDFDCTYRGRINAKNKGMIDMYFVEGKKQLQDSPNVDILQNQ